MCQHSTMVTNSAARFSAFKAGHYFISCVTSAKLLNLSVSHVKVGLIIASYLIMLLERLT